MKRLYFLIDDLDQTEQVSAALHRTGVTDWNFHAISRDEAGLYNHHVHSARPYQRRDFVHTGERWAMVAAGIGLLVGAAAESVQLLPVPIDWLSVGLFTLVCGAFGGWIGGMVGFSRENYKLAPFHDELAAGKTLVLVDVPKDQLESTQNFMRERFPSVRYMGADSTFINPLERPRALYQPTTQ